MGSITLTGNSPIAPSTGLTIVDLRDNFSAILSNENQTIPCDKDGLNGNYTGANTTMSIYQGTRLMSFNDWYYSATISPSGGVTGDFALNSSNVNVYTVTGITVDSATVTITATSKYDATVTLSKVFTLTRTKAATSGVSPTIYRLSTGVVAISKSTSGSFSPDTYAVNLNAITEATSVAYSGKIVVDEFDGSNWTNKYTSLANESSKMGLIPSATAKTIRVRMYKSTVDSTLLDEQSIVVVSDGATGSTGASGASLYNWVKYADNTYGANMSDSPTGRSYIGIAYNKTSATASTNASDYSWSLLSSPNISWNLSANVAVDASGRLSRIGGTDGWTEQAYSTQGYKSGCSLSFRVNQTNKAIMMGLDGTPSVDATYTTMEYAWYMASDATLQIFENGTRVAQGIPYVAGDNLKIVYDNSKVRYYQNNVLKRELIVAADLTLYIDSSFYSANATYQIGDVEFVSVRTPGWIGEWDGTKATVGTDNVVTPKLFAGTIASGVPTGIAIGKDIYTGDNNAALISYASGVPSIKLNKDGSASFGSQVGRQFIVNTDGSVVVPKITTDELNIGVGEHSGYLTNGRFTKWSGTYPDGTYAWGTAGNLTKELVDTYYMPTFACTTAGTSYGMNLDKTFFANGINLDGLQYFCLEMRFRLTSGTSAAGASFLVDVYRTDNTSQRFRLDASDAGATLTTNTWYTIRKVFAFTDANVAKTYKSIQGYLLANYPTYGDAVKTIQFASVNFYQATKQDYLSQGWTTTNSTTINGGSIETGTVTADKIIVGGGEVATGNIAIGKAVSSPAANYTTTISAASSAGATTLTLASMSTVIIGATLTIGSEQKAITAISGSVVTLNSALTNAYASGTTVTMINAILLTDNTHVVGSPYITFGTGNKNNNSAESAYIQYNLGQVYRIAESRAFFYSGDTRYYWYKIKYSVDGTNWYYAVGNAANNGWVTSAPSTSGKPVYNPSVDKFAVPIAAQFIRIYGNGNSVNNSNHLYEWELYSTAQTIIDGSSIKTGTLTADKINGGILTLGGSGKDGQLLVKDINDTPSLIMNYGYIDAKMIKFTENFTQDIYGTWNGFNSDGSDTSVDYGGFHHYYPSFDSYANYNVEIRQGGIKVGGWDSSSSLPLSGITLKGSQITTGGLEITESPFVRTFSSWNEIVRNENVSSYSSNSTTVTGTMRLDLPTTGWTSTMLTVEVTGYDYITGPWKIVVGGYNYSATPAWVRCYASRVYGTLPFSQVRFAYDGARCCILLGTTTTVWNYPKLILSKVDAEYSNTNLFKGYRWDMYPTTSETSIANVVTITNLGDNYTVIDETTVGQPWKTAITGKVTQTPRVLVYGGWDAGTTSYTTSQLEIRSGGTNGTDHGGTPRIAFHRPGQIASQLGMDTAGVIRTYDNPGTGYENFAAKNITAYGYILPQTSIQTLDNLDTVSQLVGDYKLNNTANKMIWTIGTDWNTWATHYGLAYEYGSLFGVNEHQLTMRGNGQTKLRFGLTTGHVSTAGNAIFGGTLSVTGAADLNGALDVAGTFSTGGVAATATAGVANSVVKRDANGYIQNTWFNSSRAEENTKAASYLYDIGDGYMRKKSLANARSEVGGYPGQIAHFARNTAPTGWLKANGAAVSRTTYAELFASIGTTFGAGDGSTTFNVPDLRGYFLRSWSDGSGIDSGRTFGSTKSGGAQTSGKEATGYGLTPPGTPSGFANRVFVDTGNDAEGAPSNVAMLACIKY